MARTAVIGLGPMGLALCGALIDRGHEVAGFDRAPEALRRAARRGVARAPSPRAAVAGVGLAFTVLPGSEEVRDAVLDPDDGALHGLPPGTPLLDMTTAGPQLADELGRAFAAADRTFLDAPVSGRAPTMTVLLGATEGALGDREPIVRDVCAGIVHCGRLGAGYTVKLLNQHVKYVWYQGACEALTVARRLGLDPGEVAAAIERCSGGSSGLTDAAEWFSGDAAAVARHGPARTIAKDMSLAAELARWAGARTPALGVVDAFFAAVDATPQRERPFPESAAVLDATPDVAG